MPGVTAASLFSAFIVSLVVSFVLTIVSRALSPDSKEDEANRGGWRARIFQSKNPLAPRDVVYGEVRKSGTVVYQEVTNDSSFLHNVIVLGTGEVEAIPVVFINDEPIYTSDLDRGRVVKGKFAGHISIGRYFGTNTQVANSTLVSESDSHWTSSHKLQGMCYIYVIIKFNRDLFLVNQPYLLILRERKSTTLEIHFQLPTLQIPPWHSEIM